MRKNLAIVAGDAKNSTVKLLRDDYNGHRPEFLRFLSDLDLRSLNDEPVYQDFIGKINFLFRRLSPQWTRRSRVPFRLTT